jgi:hypothetical protein
MTFFFEKKSHQNLGSQSASGCMYPIVAPLELGVGTALFSPLNVFYTDGSLMDGVAGFAVHHSIDCNIGFQMRRPTSVFTAELAAIRNLVFNAQSVARDLLPLAIQKMLDKWQKSWEVPETENFLNSIFPRVSLRPWFEEWRAEKKLITTVSRINSGHCGVRSHLKKFSIFDGSTCVCLEHHETVGHIIWKCSRFLSQRACLIQRLLLSGLYEETPIRDLCVQLNWKALRECFMYCFLC